MTQAMLANPAGSDYFAPSSTHCHDEQLYQLDFARRSEEVAIDIIKEALSRAGQVFDAATERRYVPGPRERLASNHSSCLSWQTSCLL